jgi:hypothetical protein
MTPSHRTQRPGLTLLLIFVGLATMGMDCPGPTEPSDTVPQWTAAQCTTSSDLGSSITKDSVCAAEAAKHNCKAWAWVGSECSCCK